MVGARSEVRQQRERESLDAEKDREGRGISEKRVEELESESE
jgi:hypothetical protein